MKATLPSRLRRLHPGAACATFAVIAVIFALAPRAFADDRGGLLRGFWGALWVWLTPPAVSAAAPGTSAVWLEVGAMIDPNGGATALAPPAAAPAGTTEAGGMSDPSG